MVLAPHAVIGGGALADATFARRLSLIGGTPAALHIPAPGVLTTNVSWPDTRTWTHANTQAGREARLGNGLLITNNGTTDAATATDTGLPATNTARTMVALIKPMSVSVTDNPIFGYGTATAKNAILWELFSAQQRVGVFTAVSDPATTSQVVGRVALLGANFDGVDTFSFFNNGAADGTSAAIAGVSTTLGGAGQAAVGDTGGNPATWGLGNKGNITTGFLAVFPTALTAAQHRAIASLCREFYGVALP